MIPGIMPHAPKPPLPTDSVPAAPTTVPAESNLIPIPDVSKALFDAYSHIPHTGDRLRSIRYDKIWVQVCKEYKIMTGDKEMDGSIWRQHQAFLQQVPDENGLVPDDPISVNEDAVEELFERIIKSEAKNG